MFLWSKTTPPCRRLSVSFFAARGTRSLWSKTAKRLVASLASGAYQAVLLDLMMPVANGVDVLNWLREAHPGRSKKSVIVLSAASERDLQKVDQSEVFAVVRKPFNLPELLGIVRKCIAARWYA